jgi:hypothetical protein
MAEVVDQQIENALNLIVCATEQSGNKKKLKKTIFETVSNLRTLFVMLRSSGDSKTSKISKLT